MKSLKNFPWLPFRLLVFVVGLGVLMSFAKMKNDQRKVLNINIKIDHPEQPYLTVESVNKLLIEKYGAITSQHKVDLVLNNLEHTIRRLPAVQSAEVYLRLDGQLQVDVTQRLPVGRVLLGERSYYVDQTGATMPLSDTHTAHVPLVYAANAHLDHKALGQLLAFTQKDAFLKTNIAGVEVLEGSRFVLLLREQSSKVYVGKAIRLKDKMNNYKAFYQKAVADGSISTYKWVNLIFDKQVVCVK